MLTHSPFSRLCIKKLTLLPLQNQWSQGNFEAIFDTFLNDDHLSQQNCLKTLTHFAKQREACQKFHVTPLKRAFKWQNMVDTFDLIRGFQRMCQQNPWI